MDESLNESKAAGAPSGLNVGLRGNFGWIQMKHYFEKYFHPWVPLTIVLLALYFATKFKYGF